MNKFIARASAAVAVVFSCACAIAEDNANAIDITTATGALDTMKTAVTSYWTAAQPVLVAVIGIALVATLIWVGYKLLRKGANKIG